jgi:adenylate kinase
MLNLLLIGPQGCGKGTQAEKIINKFGLIHIEAGALIRKRAELHDKKSEIIDHLANKKGQLLPDGIVLSMIIDELNEHHSDRGYLFDGFPRSVNQYLSLKDILSEKNLSLTAGIYLSIPDEETLLRLQSRRNCSTCHQGYSLLLEPERTACACGGTLVKRKDDEPEAIKTRLNAFHQSTEPILSLLKEDKLLITINGVQPVDTVFNQIKLSLISKTTSS